MRVALAPISTVVLLALAAASPVLGVVDQQLSLPCRFVLGSRKIACATLFLDAISKIRGTDKITPGPIDSSSNQALTTSPSSSSPSVPADSDLDFLAVLLPHARNDEQPKSSFEVCLISEANRPTPPSSDALASSSSFSFITAAAAAANVDSKIADGGDGHVEASFTGGDAEKYTLDEYSLGAGVPGDGVLAVGYDGMIALDLKKEESHVSFVMLARTFTYACFGIITTCTCEQSGASHIYSSTCNIPNRHVHNGSYLIFLDISLSHLTCTALCIFLYSLLPTITTCPDNRHCRTPSS